MTILDEIVAYGHENILCTHKSTIEITKDDYLTENGDCILGIGASKACIDLNSKLKETIWAEKKIKINIRLDDLLDSFYGFGNKDLTLLNTKDIVFRKSDFICDRTVLIKCSKSSNELNKNLISKLKINENKFTLTFELIDSDEG